MRAPKLREYCWLFFSAQFVLAIAIMPPMQPAEGWWRWLAGFELAVLLLLLATAFVWILRVHVDALAGLQK